MLNPSRVLQPRAFDAFRCIGADCEDTCCDGWGITVDRDTYTKYQQCGDPRLSELVTINTTDVTDDHYAKITLSGTRCPFVEEGLCSIQNRFGEEYLSKTCATFPRITNIIDDLLQKSLDLSCPEAARMVLLNPEPIEFLEEQREQDLSRLANLSVVDTSVAGSDKPYEYFWEIRDSVISLLQDRSYPLSKRLVLLGHICDKEVPEASEIVSESSAQPVVQLEIVLELIVARITSDFTNRRFLDCYQEFMAGLAWTTQSSMEDLGRRYTEAYDRYYAPFMSQHEYMLENYLVNYAYKTLFPFGPQKSSHHHSERSVLVQYMLMTVYFAIIKTVLIGMAGLHGTALNTGHVVKLIQSFTRAFEHSLKYPDQVVQILASKGLTDAPSMAVLVRN